MVLVCSVDGHFTSAQLQCTTKLGLSYLLHPVVGFSLLSLQHERTNPSSPREPSPPHIYRLIGLIVAPFCLLALGHVERLEGYTMYERV